MKNPMLSSSVTRLLLLLVGVALSGCVSTGPTVNYYLLTPEPGSSVAAKRNLRVGVGPVELPEYLSRPHILVQAGGSRVVADKNHRWAGPLEKNFTDVLTTDIGQRLGTADVAIYPWETPGSVDRQVVIQVTRFIASGDRVHLDARWRVLNRHGTRLQSETIALVENTDGDDYDAIVSAMSRLTGRFADRIVQAL
ncbi:MAG: PqiC family protein [Gammaproteobacteria bacterium]|jgi:uncharacterized protein